MHCRTGWSVNINCNKLQLNECTCEDEEVDFCARWHLQNARHRSARIRKNKTNHLLIITRSRRPVSAGGHRHNDHRREGVKNTFNFFILFVYSIPFPRHLHTIHVRIDSLWFPSLRSHIDDQISARAHTYSQWHSSTHFFGHQIKLLYSTVCNCICSHCTEMYGRGSSNCFCQCTLHTHRYRHENTTRSRTHRKHFSVYISFCLSQYIPYIKIFFFNSNICNLLAVWWGGNQFSSTRTIGRVARCFQNWQCVHARAWDIFFLSDDRLELWILVSRILLLALSINRSIFDEWDKRKLLIFNMLLALHPQQLYVKEISQLIIVT